MHMCMHEIGFSAVFICHSCSVSEPKVIEDEYSAQDAAHWD